MYRAYNSIKVLFEALRSPVVAFLAWALLGAFAAPAIAGSRQVEVPPDIRRIVERGELVVAMPRHDAPPFFYQKDGETQGIDAELARGLAKELKVKLRFDRSAASFNEVVDVIARGEADVAICKLSRTLVRARTIRFSEPYLSLRHVLALNRLRFAELAHGRDLPSVIRRFEGTLGVIVDSSYADFARHNFPHAKILEYPDWAGVVAALKQGEVAAAYRDEFEIKRLLKTDPLTSLLLRTVTLTDTQDTLGIAVAHDSHQLLSLINLYLAQRPEKLSVEKILRRHDAD
ncbi:MAG: amino acid ABC transporter substrate-binding protein [Sulfuricella sp.]|nr:amino acid ABC transporter substrate-binding protein [Sulfuricella sp.]